MRSPVPFLALFALACDNAPSDLRPWRASDHDHTTNPGADQVQGGPDAGTSAELAQHGLNEVTIVAWQQNCTRCHGRLGRGDGPQGVALRATDFSNPRWQASVTDEQILVAIRDGKGAMPKFPLPDSTLKPLVQLVRLFGQASAPAASGSAPAGGAASARPLGSTAGRPMPPGHPPLSGRPSPPAAGPLPPAAGPLPPGHPEVPGARPQVPPGHPPLSGRPSPPTARPLPPGHPELPAGHPPLNAPAGP